MGFNCGIVGLPNVGKSTLFNALIEMPAAEVANYPFCTIKPNIGRVAVPDDRLGKIADLANSTTTVPNYLEIVDIAGLVRGASNGEGLGNQFLARIREVDALIHVIRCFESSDTAHIDGTINPERDLETIETELLLADLQQINRSLTEIEKLAKTGARNAKRELELMRRLYISLNEGTPVRHLDYAEDEGKMIKKMNFLTAKPVLCVCNVDENHAKSGNTLSDAIISRVTAEGTKALVVSAAIESEISQLSTKEERTEFLTSLDLEEPGLAHVIRAGYASLDLITFFTSGPKETRAWTVERTSRASEAAGRIHTDFKRGFICAETIAYDDFIKCAGELGAKDKGKMRQEGSDYIVQDGDIILFRFNV